MNKQQFDAAMGRGRAALMAITAGQGAVGQHLQALAQVRGELGAGLAAALRADQVIVTRDLTEARVFGADQSMRVLTVTEVRGLLR